MFKIATASEFEAVTDNHGCRNTVHRCTSASVMHAMHPQTFTHPLTTL